jgi:hypothetical protein
MITTAQYNFGIEKIEKLNSKLNVGITEEQLAKILLEINKLSNFWQWVNAEDFLYEFIENMED